ENGEGEGAIDIRQKGYAVSRGERDPDVAAIAVGIFDGSGQIKGALTLSGPISRFDSEFEPKLAHLLSQEAAKLNAKLSN
ncbi:MAG: IclR family transcriptional regulator C-terminal domain-containing protein, partial [Alphaproteobacteria bacterium]|nr:IclR family transcriptional regulator C-terminal domain-containing protein [Alphaproteobacteria bacterium]